MIAKPETIAEIMRLNPTARPDFLAEFGGEELSNYLCRLREISRKCESAGPMQSMAAPSSADWN